jgi:hypothetical protein
LALWFGVKHYCDLPAHRLALAGLLVLAGLTASACNSSSLKLYPVTGKVLYKDQPADGAQVVFQPTGGATPEKPMAYGTVGADGSFNLRTEPHGEGAVPGDYDVLVTWLSVNPKDEEARITKLPAKWADPAKPLLKATVKESNNELEPFRLN